MDNQSKWHGHAWQNHYRAPERAQACCTPSTQHTLSSWARWRGTSLQLSLPLQGMATLPPLMMLIERMHTVRVTKDTMISQGWHAQKRP